MPLGCGAGGQALGSRHCHRPFCPRPRPSPECFPVHLGQDWPLQGVGGRTARLDVSLLPSGLGAVGTQGSVPVSPTLPWLVAGCPPSTPWRDPPSPLCKTHHAALPIPPVPPPPQIAGCPQRVPVLSGGPWRGPCCRWGVHGESPLQAGGAQTVPVLNWHVWMYVPPPRPPGVYVCVCVCACGGCGHWRDRRLGAPTARRRGCTGPGPGTGPGSRGLGGG